MGGRPTGNCDATGLYKVKTGNAQAGTCNPGQTECVDRLIKYVKDLVENSVANGRNCFDRGTVGPPGRTRPGAGPAAKRCRADLSQCLLDTLASGVEFRCHNRLTNPHGPGEVGATVGGPCLESKRPRREEPKRDCRTQKYGPVDDTCKACSPSLLSSSHINLSSVPSDPSQCDPVTNPNAAVLASLIVHEIMHLCVGPNDNGTLDRPGAGHLDNNFRQNCMGGRGAGRPPVRR